MPSNIQRSRQRWLQRATVGLFVLSSFAASATTFQMRDLPFAGDPNFSITARGSLDTLDGTATLSGWHITVTTRETLGHFTSANTANLSSGPFDVSAGQLRVATSPDGVSDGGTLLFRAPNPFIDLGVAPADFSASALPGGMAFYLAGGNLDTASLGQADGGLYVAGLTSPSDGSTFDLVPITFSGGAVLRGTLRTNVATGAIAATDIQAWDIVIEQVTEDLFEPGNSSAQAIGLELSSDGSYLSVGNPDGLLRFVKGSAAGHLFAVQVADFTDPNAAGGTAAYLQGRFASYSLPLDAPARLPWRITGNDPVGSPVTAPDTLLMTFIGVIGLLVLRRRTASRTQLTGAAISHQSLKLSRPAADRACRE